MSRWAWTLRGLALIVCSDPIAALEELSVGVIAPITRSSARYAAIAVAFDLDFRKNFDSSLVARFGPPVVNVPNLNESLRIKVQLCDDNNTEEVGTRCAFRLLEGRNGYDQTVAFVGTSKSFISMPIAVLGSLFKIPQVSFASTNPKLSDTVTYPYFMRTVPPDTLQGSAMWAFVQRFEVPSVAFIYTHEPYGEGLFQVVVNLATAQAQGFRISGLGLTYVQGGLDLGETANKLKMLGSFGTRAMIVAMSSAQGKALFTLTRSLGWHRGQNAHQLLGSEVLSPHGMDEVAPVGYMWLSIRREGPLNAKFYDEIWARMVVDDVGGSEARSRYRINSFEHSIDLASHPLSPDIFNGDLATKYANGEQFLFDALYSLAFAASSLMNSGLALSQIRGKTLLDSLLHLSFEGISGDVIFNEYGDRVLPYDIKNVKLDGRTQTSLSYYPRDNLVRQDSDAELVWMTGETSWTVPASLIACEPGFWLDATSTRTCQMCEPGTISAGGSATECDPCSAGMIANADRGATACIACDPGNFTVESKSTACSQCPPGHFQGSPGQSACEQCPLGTFSADVSAASCESCSVGKRRPELFATHHLITIQGSEKWVPVLGALTNLSCGCIEGTYRSIDAAAYDNNSHPVGIVAHTVGECELCDKGMICPGMGEVLLEPFHFATSEEPGFVFRCFGHNWERCPGGRPGTCAEGRNVSTLTCAACELGRRPSSRGRCDKCEESDTIPLLLLGPFILILMLILHRMNMPGAVSRAHTKPVLLMVLASSQWINWFQTLNVFSSINLQWEPPFATALDFVSLFAFRLDYFRLECFSFMDPLGVFLVRVFAIAGLFAIIGLIHMLSLCVCRRGSDESLMPALIGSVGTIFSAFFISIVAATIAPLQCDLHPNGLRTVREYPSVVCWNNSRGIGDDVHAEMVYTAIIGLLFPLFFLAGTCYVVWKLPERLSSGDTAFLSSYRFLFFRFRPGAHWYSLVYMFRGLFIAIVPAIENQMAQVLVLHCILVPVLFFTASIMPWVLQLANLLEAINTMLLCLLLVLFALFVEGTDPNLLGDICMVILLAIIIGIILLVAWGLYARFLRRGKTYQFFICHHKAGAGNFSRLLKMCLLHSPHVTSTVFLDSDDLWDLGGLFAIVRCDVGTIVVACSKEVLTRPWCVGEISSAHLSSVPLVKIILPGFEWPENSFVEHYGEHMQDFRLLSQYGMTLAELQGALRWLQDCEGIDLPDMVTNYVMTCVVSRLVGFSPAANKTEAMSSEKGQESTTSGMLRYISHKSTTRSHSQSNAILTNLADSESASAALVLLKLLLPLMQSTPNDIPIILEDDCPDSDEASVGLPLTVHQIILVCDTNMFKSLNVIGVLMEAAERRLAVLPVVTDSAFRFPTRHFLMELAVTSGDLLCAAGVPYSGEVFAAVVASTFKEIASEVDPQDAMATLAVRAAAVHMRLARGIRKLDVDLNSEEAREFIMEKDLSANCARIRFTQRTMTQRLTQRGTVRWSQNTELRDTVAEDSGRQSLNSGEDSSSGPPPGEALAALVSYKEMSL